MPSFSKKSRDRLETCSPNIQRLFNELIIYEDCSVICGHRNVEEQARLFAKGASKVRFGKHNNDPSTAIDAAPFPIVWGDAGRFRVFAGKVLLMAKILGISIRWGGDWDMDTFTTDQEFNDLVHFEEI